MATVDVTNPAREVLNQAPPLQPINLFEIDLALREALEREGGGWGVDRAREAGAVAGSVEALEHGRRAERNVPILRTHDRYGNRIDEVELDPSWHWLLRGAIEREMHGLPWRVQTPGGRTVRAALFTLWGNANDGVMCPVSMTYAAIPALRDGAPELAAEWEPRLTRPDYDTGALAGMAMTERQGGSDVRANITRAEPLGDGTYEIHGHKWFCSYPPCDVFLVLAQAPGGLSCFLVERGPGMEFQRLKDKLGTRSLPSSEVEFHGATRPPDRRGGPRRAGDHPDGQPHPARLSARGDDGAATGDLEAIHHARHRRAFGALLVDQPAMRNVLADLAVESEATTVAAMRVARSYDERDEGGVPAVRHRGDEVLGLQAGPGPRGGGARVPGRQRLRRGLGDAVAVSRRAARLDLGGLGQRRRARRAARDGQRPRGLPAFMAECELAQGGDPRLDAHLSGHARPGARAVQARASPSSRPGGWSRSLPWRSRRRCWSDTRRRRWPTRSAPRGWPATAGGSTARCRRTVDAGAIIERAFPV